MMTRSETIKELALRFVIPDPSSEAGGLVVSSLGSPETVFADASVRQAIRLLLRTRPGERVMRPEYGCDLYRLIFSPNDETTAGLAIHFVREAVERWEPRVQIVKIDAGADPERPEILGISLQYTVIATGSADDLTLNIALSGESG